MPIDHLYEIDRDEHDPILDVGRMDHNLLGQDFEKHPGPHTALERARILAQVPGSNFQNGLYQAVQGQPYELEYFGNKFAKEYEGFQYNLMSWVAYNIGRGDPNCANYHNWAGLVIEGNYGSFEEAKEELLPVIAQFYPERKPVHPELQKLLKNSTFKVHFTARRIPEIKYLKDKKAFSVSWPGNDLNETVGTPPKLVAVE